MLLMVNDLRENIEFSISQKTCSNKQAVNRAYILWVLLIIGTYNNSYLILIPTEYRIQVCRQNTVA